MVLDGVKELCIGKMDKFMKEHSKKIKLRVMAEYITKMEICKIQIFY